MSEEGRKGEREESRKRGGKKYIVNKIYSWEINSLQIK